MRSLKLSRHFSPLIHMPCPRASGCSIGWDIHRVLFKGRALKILDLQDVLGQIQEIKEGYTEPQNIFKIMLVQAVGKDFPIN